MTADARGPRRRAVLGALATGVVAGCTPDPAPGSPSGPGTATRAPAEPGPQVRITPPSKAVAISGSPASAAITASRIYFAASPVAVLTTTTALPQAISLGIEHHWPTLLADPGQALEPLRAELARLGVDHVLTVGGAPEHWSQLVGPDVAVIATGASSSPPTDPGADLPTGRPPARGMGHVLVADGTLEAAAVATARAAGATPYPALTPDARVPADLVTQLRADPASHVVVIGSTAVTAGRCLRTALMAQRASELPGGGHILFPDRRMVALYGHPATASLGLLGEQDAAASVERARALAARYAPLVSEPVIPAFEIIATVAASTPTRDGNYSNETAIAELEPLVAAAGAAGMYAVLDLQPGRSDFLTQARMYEPLLTLPHVGLALDPEWRLGPNEKPLRRIGSVGSAEINTVIAWLAELVHREQLPQKLLTLHQFQLRMIRDRQDLDLSHPEIAVLVHADGQGSQHDKQATWHALQQGLPKGIWLGWKNFHDEDHPMLTPEQTIAQARPTPFFISYQ